MPIQKAYVLHFLPNSADFEFLQVKDVDQAFDSFLHCKALFSLQQANHSLFSKVH